MSNFDVVINGIQPDHIENTQEIIRLLTERFKVSKDKIERMIATPNTKVRKSIPKEDAVKLQNFLSQMGLICFCQPSLNETGLSLKQMEIETVQKSCPNCQANFPDDLNALPEICDSCGIVIKKFLERHNPESDRYKKEQIRQQLSRQKSSHLSLKQKRQREEAEAQHRKELEDEILNESPHLRGKKKSKFYLLPAIGGCCLVGGSIFYAYQENYLPWVNSSSTNDPVQIEELPTSFPMSDSQISSDGGMNSPQMATAAKSGIATEGSSQDAMQKTHDQSAQVLNSFGLDPGAFANTSGGEGNGSLSRSSINQSASLSGISSSNELSVQGNGSPSVGNNSQQSASQSGASVEKVSLLNTFLLNVGTDEHEWNYFLAQNIRQLITQNKFTTANSVLSYLTEVELFIDLSGDVSKATSNLQLKSQINTQVRKKIKRAPSDFQAQYFSQMAAYQDNKRDAYTLFDRTENLWSTRAAPEQQLLSALKIAVSYFKAGDAELSNQYFSKIKLLLPKIVEINHKIQAYIKIGQAFQQIEQQQAGSKWFQATDQLIQESSNNLNDQSLYDISTLFLDSGLIARAANIIGEINDPTTKILAYTLLASYAENATKHLVAAEILLNKATLPIGHQALILSRIAQQYAKQSNMTKVNILFQKSTQLINRIPRSNERDKLLVLMINNYARSSKNGSAKTLVRSIQSTSIKTEMLNKISSLSRISKLLN
jgi:transcription initiation factor TFIIIB Brf1 subunit/transcription initiation factor TFIIB